MTTSDHPSLAAAFAPERSTILARTPAYVDTSHAVRILRELFRRIGVAADTAEEPDVPEHVAHAHELLRAATVGTLSTVRLVHLTRDQAHQPGGRPNRGFTFNPISWIGAEERPPPPPPVPRVHVESLLAQVEAAIEAADRLTAAAAPPPPTTVVAGWAEDKELINLFHDLLSADVEDDGQAALDHVIRLRKEMLLRHGIRTVLFDGSNEELFGFVTGPADQSESTSRPALVTEDGRLLRRGEVRGPAGPEPSVPATDSSVENAIPSEGTSDV